MRFAHGKADNGEVRISRLSAVLAATFLCAVPLCLPQVAATPRTPAPEARVDINHASFDELMKVPGMTQSWAGRIVRFRPYRTRLDLVQRGVVTSQVYYRIRDYVIAHRDR